MVFRHDEVKLSESTPEERNYKKGTVGAVALDVHGNLAAATSTGGMTNKAQGRIGDSPIIGRPSFISYSRYFIIDILYPDN